MNCIKRYFKKQRLQAKIRHCMNEVIACDNFLDGTILGRGQLREFVSKEAEENRNKILEYFKQLKELEK